MEGFDGFSDAEANGLLTGISIVCGAGTCVCVGVVGVVTTGISVGVGVVGV